MEDIAARFILLVSGIFVVVDPIGTIPLMLSLTGGHSQQETRAVIRRASFFGAAFLLMFALAGARLLVLFHINLDAFRIAGGVLLFLTALDMMKGGQRKDSCTVEQPTARGDISFVPLGMPSLAGPGAITSVIVFSTDHANNHLAQSLVLSGAVITVFLLSYLILRASLRVQRFLGTNGLMVLSRVMGLFLAAMAVQFVLEGAIKLAASFKA